jgi:hypothetical protein
MWCRESVRSPALLRVLLTVYCVTIVAQAAGQGLPASLTPKTYTSRSGHIRLKVESSDRYGGGAATYWYSRDGKEVWTRQLPITLWDGGVTDRGVIVGYAYTTGLSAYRDRGDLVVLNIDASGAIKLQKATQRNGPIPVDGAPGPWVRAVIVDEANDRAIFRLGPGEEWRSYTISTATPLASFQPEEFMDHPTFHTLTGVGLVPGTPLILLHWVREDRVYAAVLTLIDARGKPVWKLDLPIDQRNAQNNEMAFELVRTRARILETSRPGEFDVLLRPERKRVSFSVTAKAGGGWIVREVARASYQGNTPQKDAKPDQWLDFSGAPPIRTR